MATTELPQPDPADPVISVSTSDVGPTETVINFDPAAAPPPGVANPEPPLPTADSPSTEEATIWEGRYSFWNFAGRFFVGALLIVGCLYLMYYAGDVNYQHHGAFRVLTILLGIVTSCFWLWLSFRIFRARFSHHYQLTSHRLFVSLGIFQRRRDMMELTDLKEVSIQQQHFLDHLFHIGTVVVVSNVSGTPILFVAGVKHPQQVMDMIYHQARD